MKCAGCGHEEKYHSKECWVTVSKDGDGEDVFCACPCFIEPISL